MISGGNADAQDAYRIVFAEPHGVDAVSGLRAGRVWELATRARAKLSVRFASA